MSCRVFFKSLLDELWKVRLPTRRLFIVYSAYHHSICCFMSLSVAARQNVALHNLLQQDWITCAALWQHVIASVKLLPLAVPFPSLLLCPRSVMSAIVTHFPPFIRSEGSQACATGKDSGSTCNNPPAPLVLFPSAEWFKLLNISRELPVLREGRWSFTFLLLICPSKTKLFISAGCSDSKSLLFKKYPEILVLL